ncbi:hypothetical protein DNTS_020424 [Danionella cerebrum]|uniref:Beta-1,4-galactosyltransferase n=1 Tax=Danionella cerebrum TaxID=2873325 RepID=A0A553QMH9_9TELE|nr:hypothetical protein DNTS_020424 [Danionella translucida]
MPDSPVSFGLLHRTCSLMVLLCVLHILVTVVYYVRNPDSTPAFAPNRQHNPQIHRKLAQQSGGVEDTGPAGMNASQRGEAMERCPEDPPRLVGPLRVEFTDPITLDLVRSENPALLPGGRYKPPECIALQKVALIIPFRKRDEHLRYFLYYLHPILQRQQLDYGIYVINQDGDEIFNRAKLLNVGYAEALKEYDYDCFIFSDVDLIPMDDRNIYKCYSQPRHLAVSMDKFGFRLPYTQYFGGVSSLSKEQFLKINGFPNNYWGWGGEDDDIFNRINSRGMSISRPDSLIGRCRMIRHERDKQNDPNPQSSLSYQVINIEKDQLFTKITVDVGKP